MTAKCYRYQYVVIDNVGNTRTYTSADVKVDTSAPARRRCPVAEGTGATCQHVSGTELFYNPSGANAGSFTVDASDASVTDAQSGATGRHLPGARHRLHRRRRRHDPDAVPRHATAGRTPRRHEPGAQVATVTNNATGTVDADVHGHQGRDRADRASRSR